MPGFDWDLNLPSMQAHTCKHIYLTQCPAHMGLGIQMHLLGVIRGWRRLHGTSHVVWGSVAPGTLRGHLSTVRMTTIRKKQRQMLARCGEKGINPCTPWVRMQNGAAAMETVWRALRNLSRTVTRSSNPISGCLSRRTAVGITKRELLCQGHCSII